MNSLLRLTVITLEDNSIRLVWTMHHIIMDGWCLSLIFGTYLEYYKLLVQGENVEVNNSTEKSFGEYVHWLGKQNTLSEISFWKEQGYSCLLSSVPDKRHIPYLERLGFERQNDFTVWKKSL